MTDEIPVACADCDTQPVLVETPYSDVQDYAVVCECDLRGIDVSECVNDNNLVVPPTGKWCNIDHDHKNK